ncbi:MAG: hypothetical protein Q8O87_04200 [bacterium]|nr:hypothetical protein [bacterium]
MKDNIISDNGDKFWHKSNSDGESWYKNGKLHREDGPAIEWPDGTKQWYINDKLHREDGPAIEYINGTKSWYINGKRHREDGPAIEYSNGNNEWYLSGKSFTEEDFAVRVQSIIGLRKHLSILKLGLSTEIDGKKYRLQKFKTKIIKVDGKRYRLQEE